MSDILINKEELNTTYEILVFLKALSPDMQEKVKTIMWWESLRNPKGEEDPKGA